MDVRDEAGILKEKEVYTTYAVLTLHFSWRNEKNEIVPCEIQALL